MPTAGATTPVKGQRKTKVGRVVSDKMDKTIVVSVERLTRHRLYKRVMKASTKFAAHDERNEAKIGDTVGGIPSKLAALGPHVAMAMQVYETGKDLAGKLGLNHNETMR